jgi:phosphate transport system substrate-binding protein
MAAKVGEGTSVGWPAGIGGRGNEGVAGIVAQTDGAIGYVEYAYALNSKIPFALVKNNAGQFIKPSAQTFQVAASSADWAATKDFYLVMTDAPGEQSYPITSAVFIVMYKQPKNQAEAKSPWTFSNGRSRADKNRPSPSIMLRCREAWSSRSKPTGTHSLLSRFFWQL